MQPSASQPLDSSTTTQQRIRIFGFVMIAIGVIGIFLGFTLAQTTMGMIIASAYSALIAAIGGGLIWLHSKPWAEHLVTGILVLFVVMIVVLDLARLQLAGATWVLFILWPALSIAILGSTTGSTLVSIVSGALLLIFPPLSMSGILPNNSLIEPAQLWKIWTMVVFVYFGLITMLTYIRRSEQRANSTRDTALAKLEDSNRELLTKAAEREVINQRFETALEAQAKLVAQIQQLETPMIRIGEGLVLLTLIGTITKRRIEHLKRTAPDQAMERRAKLVVLDLTGAIINDDDVIHELDAFINIFILLGCEVRATGFSPELAALISRANTNSMLLERTGRLETMIRGHFRQPAAGTLVKRQS